MVDTCEAVHGQFTPGVLLAQLKAFERGESFSIISGEVGGESETTVIGVSSHHVPLHGLIDPREAMKHYGIAMGFIDDEGLRTEGEATPLPSTEVSLTISGKGHGNAFDASNTWFRLLRGTLTIYSEELDVRIAQLDLGNGTKLFWLHRDDPVV